MGADGRGRNVYQLFFFIYSGGVFSTLKPPQMADIAVGALAMLPSLKDKFDFVTNYLYFTFAILQKPMVSGTIDHLWLFFRPLDPGSWVFVVFCSFLAALVMATLNYFSPNQVNYGFNESVFVTFGCLFQGLTVSPPNTWSSRIMQCIWWFFVLFFIVIYIANYAALKMANGITGEASGFNVSVINFIYFYQFAFIRTLNIANTINAIVN